MSRVVPERWLPRRLALTPIILALTLLLYACGDAPARQGPQSVSTAAPPSTTGLAPAPSPSPAIVSISCHQTGSAGLLCLARGLCAEHFHPQLRL